MIPATAGDFLPSSAASRGTLLSVIVAGHVLAAAALISMRGIEVVVHHLPLLVQLVPEQRPHRPETPVRTVPLPQMRVPEVKLPELPPIENLYTLKMVEERPSPAPVAKAAPSPTPPVPVAAPAHEPPRFDLAYLNNPSPAYPIFAKRAKEQGLVQLRVRVDPVGNVKSIELHKSSGFPRLDEAALAAVRRWRFVPARAGDSAVAGVAIVPIHFQLEG